MQGERFIPCPTNQEVRECCPLFPNCHLSTHHEVKQELQRKARAQMLGGLVSKEYYRTVREYVQHPMHKIVSCRWIHTEQLDPTAVTELPPEEEMNNWLERQRNGA